MKKRIIYYLCFLILGCIIGLNIRETKNKYITRSHQEDRESLYIEYGDKLPVGTFDFISGKSPKSDTTSEYVIWLYIDPNCESCVENFSIIKRLNELIKTENVEINILWKNEPRKKLIGATKISKNNQFIVGQTDILNEYPVYFITDKNNRVEMISDDIEKIMKKLLSLKSINQTKIIEEANGYLHKLIIKKEKKKQDLVYFAMEGCPDCSSVEKILKENNIRDRYNMITIYTDDSKGEKDFIDEGGILKNIYGIDWYPSFLIIENKKKYEVIKKETNKNILRILQENK